MADLIEREAVLRAIESASCWGHTFNALYDEVHDMPAVDAMAVIRCKDCRYFRTEDIPPEARKWAVNSCCVSLSGLPDPEPDDFCSYGERRNGDAAD